MYDVSVEQIVKVKPPVYSIVFKIVMIIACVLAVTTIPSTYGVGVFLLAAAVVITVIVFKYYNAEYEYSLVEGELTVDKIMARSFRRRCGVYVVSRAVLVAPQNSQDALRMEHKKLRSMDSTPADGTDGNVVLYLYNKENELVKIMLKPDERMTEALKQVSPKEANKL